MTGAVEDFLTTAPEADLMTLAGAALQIAAELNAAANWDGAADWLVAITEELSAALEQATVCTPRPGDTAGWRAWLGEDHDPWFSTYAAPDD